MSQPPIAPTDPAPAVDVLGGAPVRWGFIGAGRIAPKLAEAIDAAGGHELVRVGARDPDRAAQLAGAHGATGGTYEDVYADERVDVVYVNTTHPFHHRQALDAISAGKHVLVEKPFALSAEQATAMVRAADEAGVFAMEAMWARTEPVTRRVAALVGEGAIGDLVGFQADFAVAPDYDPGSRLFDIDNGGGVLLDLGIYPAAIAWAFLGRPDSVQVMGSLAPTGADHVVAMQWGYETGAFAQMSCTLSGHGPGRATLLGRKGWVCIEPHYAMSPTRAILSVGDDRQEIVADSRGFVHEVEEVGRCLRSGLRQSPLVPLDDTIGVLEILDCARSELGVRYPTE